MPEEQKPEAGNCGGLMSTPHELQAHSLSSSQPDERQVLTPAPLAFVPLLCHLWGEAGSSPQAGRVDVSGVMDEVR